MATHADEPPVKVLSIVGTGRSGTTVLAAILGEVPGFFNAGELHWIWGRSLEDQSPCGCGCPPAECPVWSRVVEGALGVSPEDQADGRVGRVTTRVGGFEKEVLARRNRWRLLRTPDQPVGSWPALDQMRHVTADLYSNLVDVTGARVIVDASKRPEDAAVLAGVPSVEQYFLHIVRDPRAVVFSWSRPKASPDGRTVMRRMRPPRIVLAWLENNASAEWLRRHVPPDRWFFTTYEEFVSQPARTISDVLTFMQEGGKAPFVTDDTVLLDVNHTLLGNPDRFRTGAITITPDDVWRSQMPRRRRLIVQIATLPLMRRYGYRWTSRPPT
jgi:hypothetical protein